MSRLIPAAVALAALALAAPAQAQITSSTITTPATAKRVLVDDTAAAVPAIAIAGTAQGTGNVDVICTRGAEVTTVTRDVPVAADGTFSLPSVALAPFATAYFGANETCRLRAVSANATPADVDRFSGPLLAVSRFAPTHVAYGPYKGQVYDYYVRAAGLGYSADGGSFGACGLWQHAFHGPLWAEPVASDLTCAASPLRRTDLGPFGLHIDGGAVYAPGQRVSGYDVADVADNPGIRPLGLEPVRFDAATGDLAITETDPFVRCAGTSAYPPSESTCPSFNPVPVQLRRTTDYTQESRVIRVVDRWSSTDGSAHRLDLTLSRLDCVTVYGVACTGTEYRFPGEASFAPHATGAVPGAIPARQPILARGAGTATRGGVGVIPAQAADGAQILGSQPSPYLTLAYSRTIPARGELVLAHYYVYDADSDHLAQTAAAVAASIPVPGRSTPAAAPAPAPAAKAAPPAFASRGRVRVRRAGRTFIVRTRDLVTCPAGGATCVLAVRGTRVKSSDTTVAAGRTARVSLRLNRRGVRALTRKRQLRFAVTLAARAGTGPVVTAQRRLTIRPR